MVDKTPPGTDILDLDATTLAAKIACREITSLEATEAYIAHLERIQPRLNCLVEDRFEEARAEAQKADRDLANGPAKGRLFGVPISIKESFHVAGMRTTSDSPSSRRGGEAGCRDRGSPQRGRCHLLGKPIPRPLLLPGNRQQTVRSQQQPWDLTRTPGGSAVEKVL